MGKPRAPAFDAGAIPEVTASNYPEPFRSRVTGRHRRRLGDAGGLTHFGVNLTRLDPGSESSMRHAHAEQDEFVYVLEGEPTLVTDAGRQKLRPGMYAAFPAGSTDGHQFVNETSSQVVFLEVGDRTASEHVRYSDVDMEGRMAGGRMIFARKDGTPY